MSFCSQKIIAPPRLYQSTLYYAVFNEDSCAAPGYWALMEYSPGSDYLVFVNVCQCHHFPAHLPDSGITHEEEGTIGQTVVNKSGIIFGAHAPGWMPNVAGVVIA